MEKTEYLINLEVAEKYQEYFYLISTTHKYFNVSDADKAYTLR